MMASTFENGPGPHFRPAPIYPFPGPPFADDCPPNPDRINAFWLRAADDVRLRVALWQGQQPRATILIFPGRTEYVEKYHHVAAWLVGQGYAVLAIDWRGQGASDRLIANPQAGHIDDFSAYQSDVAAMLKAARQADLPEPWHLLCHSMGGAIGLRALQQGLAPKSVVFSAPMWGIRIRRLPDWLGPPLARFVSAAGCLIGLGQRQLSGESLPPTDTERRKALFDANPLTSDPDWWEWLGQLNAALPEYVIGPPTLSWLNAALAECRVLSTLPAPNIPALITLSGDEDVVSPPAIRIRARHWPGADFLRLPGARHEALIERPAIRDAMLNAALARFDGC